MAARGAGQEVEGEAVAVVVVEAGEGGRVFGVPGGGEGVGEGVVEGGEAVEGGGTSPIHSTYPRRADGAAERSESSLLLLL